MPSVGRKSVVGTEHRLPVPDTVTIRTGRGKSAEHGPGPSSSGNSWFGFQKSLSVVDAPPPRDGTVFVRMSGSGLAVLYSK